MVSKIGVNSEVWECSVNFHLFNSILSTNIDKHLDVEISLRHLLERHEQTWTCTQRHCKRGTSITKYEFSFSLEELQYRLFLIVIENVASSKYTWNYRTNSFFYSTTLHSTSDRYISNGQVMYLYTKYTEWYNEAWNCVLYLSK